MRPEEFQSRLNGAICLMLTPFRGRNMWNVDHEAIRQNLRFLIKHKVRAVALTDVDGECPALTDGERKAVWETVVDEAKDKLILIGGNGHYSLKGAIELTRYGEKIGLDGFMTTYPFYHNFDQEGLYIYFKSIAEATSLGVLVDNNPGFAKVNITPNLMDKLAQIRNVVGMKETGYNMLQFYQMLQVMEKYHKPVLSGMGATYYAAGIVVSKFSAGFFSVTENWWPDGVMAVSDSIRRGDMTYFGDFLRRMAPYMALKQRIYRVRQHSGLAVAKEPMDMLEGVRGGSVRLPLTPLNAIERRELRGILRRLGLRPKGHVAG